MDQQALHRALLTTLPPPVLFQETHISRLYFSGNRVFKLKKPVNFGFLDFTTLAQRHHFCAEEVRLNQRFAPDTYLGVVALRLENETLLLDGEIGEIVEYAVEMRRLPAKRMLDRLLAEEAPELIEDATRLGRLLGEIHGAAPICRHEAEPYAAALRHNWNENFAQVEPLVGPTLTTLALSLCRAWVTEGLDRNAPRLTEREAAGLVREGHGDLHAEHICLTEPIRIYDCIEFNRRFRVDDILADLAFLLMDLDFRGRRDLSSLLHTAWSETIGDGDDPALLKLYLVYRAFIRGKVNTFLASDRVVAQTLRDEATTLAQRYFNLALGYLAPPTLILTCGLMGVGKSSVARALARALGATHLRSDIVRKTAAGLTPEQHNDDDYASGLYAAERTRQTYELLLHQALTELAAGRSVIIDASFAQAEERTRFRQAAARMGCPLLLLHLLCDERIALQRLQLRSAAGVDPSDGRVELYPRQAAHFSIPEPAEGAIELDTSHAIEINVQQALVALLRTIIPPPLAGGGQGVGEF